MPNEYPYFPLYVDDLTSDGKVEAMTTTEFGAYLLLLCKAWKETPRGTVPNDELVLQRWARLSREEWAACRDRVLACWRLGDDGRWHQKRMELEAEKLYALVAKRSEAGRKGAEARHSGKRMRLPGVCHKQTDGKPLANRWHSESESELGEESPKNPSCPEPAEPAAGPTPGPVDLHSTPTADAGSPVTADGARVVLEFPTTGRGAALWPLIEAKLREYAEAFPGLDVLAESRKALQWCRDNPAKRKTPRGMPAFLWRWFERSQNRGGGGGGSNGVRPSETREQRVERIRRERETREAERRQGGVSPGLTAAVFGIGAMPAKEKR